MTQHTADLHLDWEKISPEQYRAVLPNIPDYTTGSSDNFVEIDYTGEDWMFSIWLELVGDISICLFNSDFGIPFGSSFEEMKQAVENLSIEDIVRKVAEKGDRRVFGQRINHNQYVTARKNTRRTASLNLQWYEELDDYDHLFYYADLPEVPGYTDAEESESYAQVYLMEDYSDIPETPGYEEGAWGFHLFIDGAHDMNLYADDFGLPAVESADEAMTMVDNLSMQDIQDTIDRVASGPAAASRMATRMQSRIAHMNLDWIDDGDDAYFAELPPIPGYTEDSPDSVAPDGVATVCVYHTPVATSPDYYWTADIRIDDLDNIGVDLYFPLGLKETAEEMMAAVENLTPEDIAQMLDDDDYKLDPRW